MVPSTYSERLLDPGLVQCVSIPLPEAIRHRLRALGRNPRVRFPLPRLAMGRLDGVDGRIEYIANRPDSDRRSFSIRSLRRSSALAVSRADEKPSEHRILCCSEKAPQGKYGLASVGRSERLEKGSPQRDSPLFDLVQFDNSRYTVLCTFPLSL